VTQSATIDGTNQRFSGARLRRTSGVLMGWMFFVALWAFISSVILDPFTLPGPIKVFVAIWDIVKTGAFIDDFQASITKTFVGFGIAVLIGVPVGYFMGRTRYGKAFFSDGVIAAGNVPGLVYALMALVIFGIGFLGPVLAVGMISMPFIALNIAEGLEAVDDNLIRMGKAYGRTEGQMVRHIQIPSILPYLFAGIRLAFAIAWKVEALTEVFGSSGGVGFQIRFAFQAFSITNVLAWTLMFIVFLLVMERLLAALERRLFRWRTWDQAF